MDIVVCFDHKPVRITKVLKVTRTGQVTIKNEGRRFNKHGREIGAERGRHVWHWTTIRPADPLDYVEVERRLLIEALRSVELSKRTLKELRVAARALGVLDDVKAKIVDA